MASLDVLDYQAALEEAFSRRDADGRPLLPGPLRRQAVKEARRLIDTMAFHFAILDERPLPEDLDYLQALEAMKPAPQAAEVLARRRPLYARVRRRRQITGWTTLAIFIFLVVGVIYLANYETAEELAVVSESAAVDVTTSFNQTFVVAPEINRLHVDGTIRTFSDGSIEVFLIDPDGGVRRLGSYQGSGPWYLRHNVLDPQEGQWTLMVDFNAVAGSATVSVDGVQRAR